MKTTFEPENNMTRKKSIEAPAVNISGNKLLGKNIMTARREKTNISNNTLAGEKENRSWFQAWSHGQNSQRKIVRMSGPARVRVDCEEELKLFFDMIAGKMRSGSCWRALRRTAKSESFVKLGHVIRLIQNLLCLISKMVRYLICRICYRALACTSAGST